MRGEGRRVPVAALDRGMARASGRHGDDAAASGPHTGDLARPGKVASWVSRLRKRLGSTEYVDAADVPDLPESPYRARLTISPGHVTPGVEVRERDIVHGRLKVVYEVRCPCGKRWFNPRFENVQVCPRCGNAVLLEKPT